VIHFLTANLAKYLDMTSSPKKTIIKHYIMALFHKCGLNTVKPSPRFLWGAVNMNIKISNGGN
jgi:hypothetical protein